MFGYMGEVIIRRSGIQITNSEPNNVFNCGTLLYQNIRKIAFENEYCLVMTFWNEKGFFMTQGFAAEDRGKMLNVFNVLKGELYREVPDFDPKNIIGAELIGGTPEKPQPPKQGFLQKLLRRFKKS